ncbi:hypothetical protein M3Y99_01772700 [Aphelenchoides fujianensis]|nr:hypothetical protein M3Y99_01772700 [Aphelenchoides fujianensis]
MSAMKFVLLVVLVFAVIMQETVARSAYAADDNGLVLGESLGYPVVYGGELGDNADGRVAALNDEPSGLSKRAYLRLGKRAYMRLGKASPVQPIGETRPLASGMSSRSDETKSTRIKRQNRIISFFTTGFFLFFLLSNPAFP